MSDGAKLKVQQLPVLMTDDWREMIEILASTLNVPMPVLTRLLLGVGIKECERNPALLQQELQRELDKPAVAAFTNGN